MLRRAVFSGFRGFLPSRMYFALRPMLLIKDDRGSSVGYFWTNTVWYLLLFAVTIAMIAIAQAKADNRRFLAVFTMAVLGLFYLFEYSLVIVLDAYRYHPMITPDDGFQDTVLGNIFSQTSIAAACGLIIALRLRPRWYFVFAAAYYLIELAFVRLGIYEPNWYEAIYTPIILVPLFCAIRRWHNHAASSRSEVSANAVLCLAVMSATAQTVFLPLKLAEIHVFTGGFFEDPSRDHTTTLLFYMVCLAGAVVYVYRLKIGWKWKALLIALLYPLQAAVYQTGLMKFRQGWFPWATALEIGVILFWTVVMDRLVRQRRPMADGLPKAVP